MNLLKHSSIGPSVLRPPPPSPCRHFMVSWLFIVTLKIGETANLERRIMLSSCYFAIFSGSGYSFYRKLTVLLFSVNMAPFVIWSDFGL